MLKGNRRSGLPVSRAMAWRTLVPVVAGRVSPSRGRLGAGQDVDIKLRHVQDARHGVVAKVALFDGAVLERNGRTWPDSVPQESR
jgi:hypothetical protein